MFRAPLVYRITTPMCLIGAAGGGVQEHGKFLARRDVSSFDALVVSPSRKFARYVHHLSSPAAAGRFFSIEVSERGREVIVMRYALNSSIRMGISVFAHLYGDVCPFAYVAHGVIPGNGDAARQYTTKGGARGIQLIRTPMDICGDFWRKLYRC